MAVVYAAATRTARMQAVLDDVDAGVGAPTLEIGTTGFASTLATVTLANNPPGSVTGDVLTFTMPQSDPSADATGTAAECRIKDGDGTIVISGLTVGTAASDLIVDSVDFNAGQQFTVNSATITHFT